MFLYLYLYVSISIMNYTEPLHYGKRMCFYPWRLGLAQLTANNPLPLDGGPSVVDALCPLEGLLGRPRSPSLGAPTMGLT